MKTSNLLWKKQLWENLKNPADLQTRRIAVLGIGNELNGDDSAGNWVARNLREQLKDRPNCFIMDCGSLPENATGPLRKFMPEIILMVDAAELGEDPGTIQFVDIDQVRGFSASSHSLPLSVLAKFLTQEFQCRVWLCCIQPLQLQFEAPLSEPVNQAVKDLLEELTHVL